MRWYKQDSSVFDRVWAKDPKMVSIYLYLHCHAYVQDGMLSGRLVRRGSCPTSRPAIMEGTGLSEEEVKLRLSRLKSYGEIIVNPTNRGMIITLCDYDGYNDTEDLFSLIPPTKPTAQAHTQTTPQEPPQATTHIEYKNIENNLRSHFIPSKQRESREDLAYEIRKLYNKIFAGVLPEWQRVSKDMIIKVDLCISRFGRQSVDMVFDQIKHEVFHLGNNKTGYICDAFKIFELEAYEKFLSRYRLRLSKKQKPELQSENKDLSQPKKLAETIDKHEAPSQRPTSAERKQNLLEMIEYIKTSPSSYGCVQLEEAYRSGELAKYGIDWTPNNNKAV